MNRELLIVPPPSFDIGDVVFGYWQEKRTAGVIINRTFNNLLHASQWRYKICWENNTVTNNHYCRDLQLAVARGGIGEAE